MNEQTFEAKAEQIADPIVSDDELNRLLAEYKFDRVTKEEIEKRIKGIDFFILPNSTTTICSIELENGYSVRGESACVDSRNFNMEVGRNIAYREAFNKIWALEGYLLAERRFIAKKLEG